MITARKASDLPHSARRPARRAKYAVVLTGALLGWLAAAIMAQRWSVAPDAAPAAAPPAPQAAASTAWSPSRPSSMVAERDGPPAFAGFDDRVRPLPPLAEAANPALLVGGEPAPGALPSYPEKPSVVRASWVEISEGAMPGHATLALAAPHETEGSEGVARSASDAGEVETPPSPPAKAAASPPARPRLRLPLFRSPVTGSASGKEAAGAREVHAEEPSAPPLPSVPAPPAKTSNQSVKIPLAGTPPADRVTLRHSGGLISLATHSAPLNEVLMALARQQNLNIVCTENLRTSITVTLDKVPLETVLDAVLSIAGCTWVRQNDVIYVTSTSDRAKLAPSVQGRQIRVFRLDFASAADVEKAVKGMLSPVGQTFTAVAKNTDNRQTQELVVVEDVPAYLQAIAAYIEQVDQPPRQVMIEAHVLAITLDSNDRCGVDLTALFKVLHHDMTFYAEGIANPAAPQAFFFTFDGSDLDLLIEALRTQSQARTLASPKVLVLNGQEAKIQVGRQDGYRVVTTTETSAMESINFLDTGVLLTVTPRISRNGQVLMRVKPEVSDGQVQDGLPSKKTTEVQTDVMLPDGRGMVIGGLIRETDVELQAKVPFFGDLYLVGKLFRRREVTKKREEIIITLIPRVVPGTLACDDRHAQEVQRAETPVLDRNLERVPRPWEGQLPDALENPARFRDIPAIKARHQRCAGCAQCLDGAGSACGEQEPYYAPIDPASGRQADPPADEGLQTSSAPPRSVR